MGVVISSPKCHTGCPAFTDRHAEEVHREDHDGQDQGMPDQWFNQGFVPRSQE